MRRLGSKMKMTACEMDMKSRQFTIINFSGSQYVLISKADWELVVIDEHIIVLRNKHGT